MNKNNKPAPFFLRVLKKIKISHLVILALLLIGNTYAWFIYIDTVSNSVDVHIKAWNIDLQDDQGTVTDTVTVYVDAVYPGMTTYEKEIRVSNFSDLAATVSYDILSVEIMGEKTYSREGKKEYNLAISQDDPTSEQLIQQLANNYPFVIDFDIDETHLEPVTGTATYTISIAWDYESGNDTLDTYWGERAYTFVNETPGAACISLDIKIKIQQDDQ
jgi:hypothetical protein